MRNAEGKITQARLKGRLLGGVREHLMTPDGLTPVKRVEAYLQGPATVDGVAPHQVTVNVWWWFRDKVGLPIKVMMEERADDRLVRRSMHEVIALDVLSLAPAK